MISKYSWSCRRRRYGRRCCRCRNSDHYAPLPCNSLAHTHTHMPRYGMFSHSSAGPCDAISFLSDCCWHCCAHSTHRPTHTHTQNYVISCNKFVHMDLVAHLEWMGTKHNDNLVTIEMQSEWARGGTHVKHTMRICHRQPGNHKMLAQNWSKFTYKNDFISLFSFSAFGFCAPFLASFLKSCVFFIDNIVQFGGSVRN